MSPILQFLNSWLARVAFEGGFILLAAWLLMKLVGQPVRKLQVGIWGAVAALIVAVGCTLSPWLPLRLLSPPDAASRMAQVCLVPISTGRTTAPVTITGQIASEPPDTYLVVRADEPAPQSLTAQPPPSGHDLDQRPNAARQPLLASSWLQPFYAFAWPQLLLVVAWLYPAGIAIFAWRWVRAQVALRRIAKQASPAPASVSRLVKSMARSLRASPRILISERLTIPATWGLLHPKILVPASLCEPGEEARLRCILAHELAHVERTDALACVFLSAAQALYFFCPWFWWLRRQIRLCQEYIADARAARQADSAADYAQLLLSFTSSEPTPQGAFGVIGRESDLFRRVSMLLEDRMIESRCPRRWSMAIAVFLVSAAIVMSGLGLASRASASPDDEAPAPPAPPAAPLPPVPPAPPPPPGAIAGGWLLTDPDDDPKSDDDSSATEDLRKAKEEYQKALKHMQEAQREWAKQQAQHARHMAEELKQRIQVQVNDEDGGPGELKRMRVMARLHGGRGRLGISYSPPSATLAEQLNLPEDQGIVITEVAKDSPAAKAGLKPHDILLEIDGQAVPRNIAKLSKFVKGLKADKEMEAVVIRKGQKETIKGLKLAEAKEEKDGGFGEGFGEGFGRTFHAMPVPPIPPVPPVFGMDNAMAHAGQGVTVMVNRDKDRFTIRRREGNLAITVTGSVSDGKSKVAKIRIKDENNSRDYDSVDAVPERYRDKVKHLVAMTQEEGGKIKIKVKHRDSDRDADRVNDKDNDEDEE
jgi:beta-lactamase regulating signal transducer with metallopeptidase domain/membrane-associated protease RseP (regulator of RpoE activity)